MGGACQPVQGGRRKGGSRAGHGVKYQQSPSRESWVTFGSLRWGVRRKLEGRAVWAGSGRLIGEGGVLEESLRNSLEGRVGAAETRRNTRGKWRGGGRSDGQTQNEACVSASSGSRCACAVTHTNQGTGRNVPLGTVKEGRSGIYRGRCWEACPGGGGRSGDNRIPGHTPWGGGSGG